MSDIISCTGPTDSKFQRAVSCEEVVVEHLKHTKQANQTLNALTVIAEDGPSTQPECWIIKKMMAHIITRRYDDKDQY